MEEFFSQKLKIAPKFNMAILFFWYSFPRVVTMEQKIETLNFCIFLKNKVKKTLPSQKAIWPFRL
jgi:hypothetical protein